MLHGAAEETQDASRPAASEGAISTADHPSEPAPRAPTPALGSSEMQERLARFNERESRRNRTAWQVIEDSPLLLRRLVSDVRRGDTHVFGELIRRGIQLQLVVVALYILSPVSFKGCHNSGFWAVVVMGWGLLQRARLYRCFCISCKFGEGVGGSECPVAAMKHVAFIQLWRITRP